MSEKEIIYLGVYQSTQDYRVICCAPDCGRSIYAELHIILRTETGEIEVWGSSCFKQVFKNHPVLSSTPKYTPKGLTAGKRLTEEQRAILARNTEEFIKQIQAQYERQQAELQYAQEIQSQHMLKKQQELTKQQELKRAEKLKQAKQQAIPYWPLRFQTLREYADWFNSLDPELVHQAKIIVREKYKIDPDLAGWHGFVMKEASRLQHLGWQVGVQI